ncbi:MAG: multidrug effflux MFS transporter [Gammaproteobacteria bacterium]|nr:multidrug effflux MFS transporter [Gammaproteobacteria bacterium]
MSAATDFATPRISGRLLGAIVAISPVALDMCLPALPAIAIGLNSDSSTVQLIVSAYLLGFATGQLLWGFFADRFGRIPALKSGIAVFLVTTLLSGMASDVGFLIAMRALQGLAAASGAVVARVIVRDVASGPAGASLMSTVTAYLGTAPLLAPMVGAAVLSWFDWRWVLWAPMLYALAVLWGVSTRLPETNPAPDLDAFRPQRMYHVIARLLGFQQFRLGAILLVLPFAGFLTFVSTSGPLLVDVYGLPPGVFGLIFGLVAMAYVLGALVSQRLLRRRPMQQVRLFAVIATTVASLFLTTLALLPQVSVFAVWVGVAVYVFGIGIGLPNWTAFALEPLAGVAGRGVSVLGFLQMGTGALVTAIAAASYTNDHRSMTASMAITGLLSTVVYVVAWRRRRFGP